MSENSAIEWTTHTFNVAWGCIETSPGCDNCYARTLSARYGHQVWGPSVDRRTMSAEYWAQPLKWNRAARKKGERARVFCSSMTDVFLNDPTINRERENLWPLILATPYLDWQILTKHPERFKHCIPDDFKRNVPPNFWLGVSIESNEYARRADYLRETPAAVHFISAEPLLGPLPDLFLGGIEWVIVGGESGANHRPMEFEWARQIRDLCERTRTVFFFKQAGAFRPTDAMIPDDLRIREYPSAIEMKATAEVKV